MMWRSRHSQAIAGFGQRIPVHTFGRCVPVACLGVDVSHQDVRGGIPIQRWCDTSCRAFPNCRDRWLPCRTRITGTDGDGSPVAVQWHRTSDIGVRHALVPLVVGDPNSVLGTQYDRRAMSRSLGQRCNPKPVANRGGTPDCRSSVTVLDSAKEQDYGHRPHTEPAPALRTASDSVLDCELIAIQTDTVTSKTLGLCGLDQDGDQSRPGIERSSFAWVHCTTRQSGVSVA